MDKIPKTEILHTDQDKIEYRNTNKHYPWWVKTVDAPTIEMDRSRAKRPDFK